MRGLIAALGKEGQPDSERLETALAVQDQCMALHFLGDSLEKTLPEAYQLEAHARTLDKLIKYDRDRAAEHTKEGNFAKAEFYRVVADKYERQAKAHRKRAAALLRKPGEVVRKEADGLAAVIVLATHRRRKKPPIEVPDGYRPEA